MKKLLLPLIALLIASAGASAQIVSQYQLFPTVLQATYDKLSDDLAEYYMLCSTTGAQYDPASGEIYAPKGMLLYLDLFAKPNAGSGIPVGTYTAGDGKSAFTYDKEYTYISVLDDKSQPKNEIAITGEITVTNPTGDVYQITTPVIINGKEKIARFRGTFKFDNAQQTTDAFYQLKYDVDTKFNGGFGLYYGNLMQANTGNMVLRLYTGKFDNYTGAMLEPGYCVELMLFGPLFSDPKDAEVAPGTYTVARNFAKNTWFPGMDANYMGQALTFGTFLQEVREDPSFGDQGYAWAYASSGTITIEDIGGKARRITLDMKSKTGYAIRGTYEGELPITDVSDDKKGAVVSTLTEDLALNIGYIKEGHIWHTGDQYGCRSFTVDLGNDSGRDEFMANEVRTNEKGADCMRLEFLTDTDAAELPAGIYQVMEENYTTYYKPGRMRQGYFANGGELTGTRWMHLRHENYERPYFYMDGLAPAVAGTITVERPGKYADDGKEVYIFRIDLIDDADFLITGEWEGPVSLEYDSVALGVSGVTTSAQQPSAIYDLSGRRVSKAGKGILLHNNQKIIR